MFWSSNYTANRELKFLLLEKNVTLTQVLEADDILQECKADYQTLSQFLSRPDILSELITLITEEPPKNVELSLQYRHANIACEVLTSNLSLLRDRLSSNSVQMNRLCDFVNKEPPLNPLLASYFSKTIDMLLEKSPKTDWYLHHIVCLRVLDFFKSRRDFVPNLLRHISTSAICDLFRCFLQNIINTKIIIEWLEEYHFLDSLIQIICGTHNPEEVYPILSDTEEKAANEPNEKLDTNHNSEPEESAGGVAVVAEKGAETNGEREEACGSGGGEGDRGGEGDAREQRAAREERARRTRGVAAANAAALLCDIALDYGPDTAYGKPWCAAKELAQRLRSEETVRRVLQGCFTSPAGARRPAVVHACRLLLALLKRARPAEPEPGEEAAVAEAEEKYREVERAVAPHLPLLHRALLKDVEEEEPREASAAVAGEGAEAGARRVAGAVRVHVAALVARLALSDVDDVPTALVSLGTAGVLIDLSFSCSHNNFLHAQLVALVRNARNNPRFGERYTTHLIEECNLLTRLMDAFEENESGNRSVRAGYMGHVVLLLGELSEQPPALPPGQLLQRWTAFREQRLKPLLLLHHAPLGGVYPQEDFQELKFNATFNTLEDGEGYDVNTDTAFINFMAQASQHLNENVWDESPADEADDVDEVDVLDDGDAPDETDDDGLDEETKRVLAQKSPWEEARASSGVLTSGSPEAAGSVADDGEGWAQFDTPFDKYPFWAASHDSENPSLSGALQNLRVSDDDKDALTILLAQKMLAFHNMAPEHYEAQDADLDTQTHTDHDGQRQNALVEECPDTAQSEANQNSPVDRNQSQNQNIHNVQIQSTQDETHQSDKECQNLSDHDSQYKSSEEVQNQSANYGQNQSTKEEQNHSPIDGSKESAHDGQNQSVKEGENQSPIDVTNKRAHDGQNQSVKEGENQSPIDGTNQRAHDGQNQSDKVGENQSSFDGSNQSAHDGQNQSIKDDQKESVCDSQSDSAQEASSAYDKQNAEAES